MINAFSTWFHRRFVGTEFGVLTLFLLIVILTFWWLSSLIMPVLVSMAIAYLLNRLVNRLVHWHVPRTAAIYLVYVSSFALLVFSLLVLLPMLWDQMGSLFSDLPTQVKKAEGYITELSQRYPAYISKIQLQTAITTFQTDFSLVGKQVLTYSVTTASKIIMLIIYLVLVPLMVYFFMKDYPAILTWLGRFLPRKTQLKLTKQVWSEVDHQLGNYISSKILEVVIVGVAGTLAFLFLGLNYAILLGVIVGLSVFIPYVGAVVVTVPVVAVGYLQWGLDVQFLYLLVAYSALMILDGNVLTPILFSETMKLHPVAVIIAILIFGGLWGFWGIFFAIPLASVVKILLNAWLENSKIPSKT